MRLISQVILLTLASALLAGIHGFIVGPEGSSHDLAKGGLTFSEAVALESALWVDARPEDAFLDGHYPGALNINEDNWGEGISSLLTAWDPGESVIVYCDGQSCSASREMAERIRAELGLEPVFWLKGGYEVNSKMEGFPE